jgi:hypothetical protein
MRDTRGPLNPPVEAFLAELTDAAYRVALNHGFQGTFIDVQLDLWSALRKVVRQELFVNDFPSRYAPAGAPVD